MKHVTQTPWTDEERAMLRRLRANGLGASKIAIMMGRSKHAVSRQLKYLDLRPSRLQRSAQSPKTSHEGRIRAGRTTLPPLPSLRTD